MNNRLRLGALFLFPFMIAFTGCLSVGPDYDPQEVEVTTIDKWHAELDGGVSIGTNDLQTWWTVFSDPLLDSLVSMSRESSPDLEIAAMRVAEQRALRDVVGGDRAPSLSGIGNATRSRMSEDFLAPGQPSPEWSYQTGLDASWEIDVWGRVRQSIQAADASVEASEEDYRDVMLILCSDVAATYIELRALQTRLTYAEKNAKVQAESVQLTQDRLEAELVPELDVLQAKLVLGVTEAAIPVLRSQIFRNVNRLAVLTGSTSTETAALTRTPGTIPPVADSVLVGTPADVLRRRPDVRRAERLLAGQTARVGVATAELLPKLSLSGIFAFEGYDDILNSDKQSWSFGPSFRWRLFEGKSIRSQIKAEDARVGQALANYERTVLGAYEDFENSVNSYIEEKNRRDALKRAKDAAESALEKVLDLYRTGLTDFQNVLDMQRSLTEQQDAYAQSAGQVAANLVRVYRAMGGGVEDVADEE